MIGRAFPLVKQRDAMQCGAASLAMIYRHHSGRDIGIDEVEGICGSSKRGVSLLAVSETARTLGFSTMGCRMGGDALSHVPLPCILHWNGNHFVVLYRICKGTYHIADPGRGRLRYSREEFMQKWTGNTGGEAEGIALLLEPGEKLATGAASHQDGRHTLRFLLRHMSGHRRQLVGIVLALAAGSALQLIMPFLTRAVVDLGVNGRDIGLIWLILLGELMIVAGSTVTDFIRRRLLLRVSMKVNISLVCGFFVKLLRLPMDYFDRKLIGDLMQRMGDHWRVQTFLTDQMLGIIFATISLIVYGTVLLIYDVPVFLIFLSSGVAYGLWISAFLKKRRKQDFEMFDCQTENHSRTFQFLTSMQEIKLQGCERRRRDEWEQCQERLFGVRKRSLSLRQKQEAGSVLINEVKDILITVVAATAVIDGRITLGTMLAIQYMVGQLSGPVSRMMEFIYSMQDVRISLERINEVHGADNEEEDGSRSTGFDGDDRSIRIEGLSFRYNPHSPGLTLDNVSIEIPSRKTTAIVGASGSGKTTLVKMMLGYYRPERGSITVGGMPLAGMDLRWLRSRCGAVMQDGVIFSESIARNIAVDDGEIDTDRMESAAVAANIASFIEGLPQRYDTVIGRDGVGISQGQRQRILIARAIYRNPDFIFLDEATNSLDAENERKIVERMRGEFRGKTVVVVAHRLSTVMDADRIIVMDNGRVAECGDHRSLTAKKGIYYNLVRNQLELGT